MRDGGFCSVCQGDGQRRKDLRRGFHRRLFRARAEGRGLRRPAADRRHPAGAGRDGTGLLQRQRRLDKGGHQHGRCAPYGAGDQKDGRADKGTRWTWLREARRVLQRRRGQPLYGRGLPRGW